MRRWEKSYYDCERTITLANGKDAIELNSCPEREHLLGGDLLL